MVNNGDVHIEKPSDCLVAQCFSCSACVLTLGVFDLKRRCTEWSVYDIKVQPMLSNGSRGTLISYTSGSQFQSSRPTALHISYVTLITSDVCSIRTQVPCEVDITRYSSMIPVRSERIPFIVHWSVRDVNLNCIYLQTYMMSHSSVRKDVAQRKSMNECSEVK